jgi:hypothetical protein
MVKSLYPTKMGSIEMNQKTILGLAAILALTLISIAGFYFFSPKHATEKTVQASTSEASSAQFRIRQFRSSIH